MPPQTTNKAYRRPAIGFVFVNVKTGQASMGLEPI